MLMYWNAETLLNPIQDLGNNYNSMRNYYKRENKIKIIDVFLEINYVILL